MNAATQSLWERFKQRYHEYPTIGLSLDLSRMNYDDAFITSLLPKIKQAREAMIALEEGSIANPDEDRMVGHYWLRNPEIAPLPDIRQQILRAISQVKEFVTAIHAGSIKGAAGPFQNVLLIGIGGSALGPQFVAHALGHPARDKTKMFFLDNTDPDGMDKVLASLEGALGSTLCVVISKSGGTKETRNGMLEAMAAYQKAGLDFAKHAVAVTGSGSLLERQAATWLRRFPMWDWVGGRTSETSAVGLLPAALQGIDIDSFIRGAKQCDIVTREQSEQNPAELLALMWFYSGKGRGQKDMVVLPYKDRLELFSKYLQQLVMESLGKEKDRWGNVVNQGLAVYGNKGSTDQHAYVQQLRDGLNNFFCVFIQVLREREGVSVAVEPGVTAGDYLFGYYMGTRQALFEKGRESITITVREVNAFVVGALIALFERAVGIYASLIGINAYHQPGVEAGKKAADAIVATEKVLIEKLRTAGKALTLPELAALAGADPEIAFKICEHLAANPERGITKTPGATWDGASYAFAVQPG